MTEGQDRETRRNLWIPAAFVLFFIALAGLQAWFVMLAQSTFTGVVTDQPYGLRRAHEGDTNARNAALGWKVNLIYEPKGPLTITLHLDLKDTAGQPLIMELVRATAERATKFPQVVPVVFRAVAPGHYRAELNLPLAGKWTVRTVLMAGGDEIERIDAIEVDP